MRSDVAAVLREDPVMAELVDRCDPYTERDIKPFERLCVSIINQQLSTESAAAVRERAFEVLGEVTPERVLVAEETALRAAGLSESKVEYLRNAARAFSEADLTPSGLAGHSDDEVVDRLTEIRGVGPWTAEMFLMGATGHKQFSKLSTESCRATEAVTVFQAFGDRFLCCVE